MTDRGPRKGQFYGKRWVTCRCGKEWMASAREDTEELLDAYLKLMEYVLCKACETEIYQATDSCPESVPTEGGAAACFLPWKHAGKCQPIDDDNLEEWAKRRCGREETC